MNNVRDLQLLPVWVNPQHLAATALHIMVGHKIKTLAVVDGGALVGIVSMEDLVAAPGGAKVAEVMNLPSATLEANTPVRTAAQTFVADNLDSAAVLDHNQFQGMVTPLMLLRELGQSYDPLTGLSWSDSLREWGIEHLKGGDEVTIVFIDLNHFGLYNKKYGHIVGDKVIAKVATYLESQIDKELDILVRYAGDEFAIGTLRDRDETEALAELLCKRFDGTMEGADEPVSFGVGVFGGRRHKERENVHYAATIDNLINIASKNCIANKKRERGELDQAELRTRDLKLLGLFSDPGLATGIITVIVSVGGSVYGGAESGEGRTVVQTIAAATAKALEKASKSRFEVLAIDLIEESGAQIVSVTGRAFSGENETAVSAARIVGGELANVVAETTMEAFRPHV